ncbi:MAG: hypothetical protein PHQ05_11650 [Sterolibacterium sp.]|nr:hypothetical protein [Sterolibacterium sp.]
MNFENVYWDWNSMQNDNHYPSILAIGDSWFWYPFPGGSLVNQLGRLVAKKEHYILALGNNGAEAFDYVYGKYSKAVKSALRFHGSALSCVFISGGGNDFAGFNDLRPLLNDDCAKATKAEDCFRTGGDERTINWLMKKTSESYRALIGQILASTNTQTKIVMHNYDYAFPSGKGVFGNKGNWLKPALENAKVPEKLHRECIKHLINRITFELGELVKIDKTRIVLVDSTNTLAEGDWANELHPKPSGFKKIAVQKWLPILKNIGLA